MAGFFYFLEVAQWNFLRDLSKLRAVQRALIYVDEKDRQYTQCYRRATGSGSRVRLEGQIHFCKGFWTVPGPLQSVQRAEMWGVISATQSSFAVHLGVDNLGVVRHVGRFLDGRPGSTHFERDTVRISKVKGHADEGMVLDGRVREIDRLGNDAADFGRERVGNAFIDARRDLSGVCSRWCPVFLDFHRFFIAISGPLVNHGCEGTALDRVVWSAGAHPKRRRLVHAVRDRTFFVWAA